MVYLILNFAVNIMENPTMKTWTNHYWHLTTYLIDPSTTTSDNLGSLSPSHIAVTLGRTIESHQGSLSTNLPDTIIGHRLRSTSVSHTEPTTPGWKRTTWVVI